MAEEGVLEYQDSAGAWHEIILYTPGTFDSEPLEVQTSSGQWAVPYLTDPTEADTPFEVQRSDGSWVGVNSVGVLTVDDFEDGDVSNWTVPSSSGSDTIVSPGLDGTNNAWQHDGIREGHLQGIDAVDRGPQPGDVFEVWFRIDSSSSTALSRFEFSADGNNDTDMYRLEWEAGSTPSKTLSIEKYVGDSQSLVDTVSFSPSDGTTYRCEIRWNVGDSNIEAEMFDSGGSSVSGIASISDDSSASGSEFTQPGIHLWTNGNEVKTWDQIRILPS